MSEPSPNATPDARNGARPPLDVDAVRADFPILNQSVNDHPLVYLDNASTSQKPRVVVEALDRYYRFINANVHRGVHLLSNEATQAYESARAAVRRFVNAPDARQIVFVRGTTEAVNLVAGSWGRANLGSGDRVLISQMEHHSNIVPWQALCRQTGAQLAVIPIDDRGDLIMAEYERLLTDRTKLVSIVHVSNSLGTVNPIDRVVDLAHAAGAKVLVDGAQAAPHLAVDVQAMDCDFYAFSGHKVFGPTGVGVLYGKEAILDAMPPYQFGGEMVKRVTLEETTYSDLPLKFEAGTPHIAGAIGLAGAIEYVESIGFDRIAAYENDLLDYCVQALRAIDGVRFIGTARRKVAVVSFMLADIHPHDVGTVLDQSGVAVRTGHHCTQPVMDRFGVPATVRASLAFYNTRQDVDALVQGLRQALEVFA